jgi:hypothetical protein
MARRGVTGVGEAERDITGLNETSQRTTGLDETNCWEKKRGMAWVEMT